jgi:hypothetical protein
MPGAARGADVTAFSASLPAGNEAMATIATRNMQGARFTAAV